MIEIAVVDDESRALWKAVGQLAGKLPGDWALIGGLMVQIHALEHGFTTCASPTTSTCSVRLDPKAP